MSLSVRRLLRPSARVLALIAFATWPAGRMCGAVSGTPVAPGGAPAGIEAEPEHVGLRVVSAQPRIKAELRNGVVFDLDAPTVGAYAMADFSARMRVEPAGVTLPLKEPAGVVAARFDPNGRQLRMQLRNGGDLGSVPIPPADRAVRICIHQRDQIALYAVTPAGAVAQVWVGRVDYRITIPEAEQYALCRRLDARMGARTLTREDILTGVRVDALDEAGDIVVRGLSPLGTPFERRYKADLKRLEGMLDLGTDMLIQTLREQGGGESP